ncbi:MAG: enoyl-CoA hydratase/isomerase family protein [Myxococcota bacterium]|nr:enoyl-CoA hydratase/isomerase family protein [Myxococcota bacterium]
MSDEEDVVITYEAEIVRMSLNRPESLNALNESIRSKIATELESLFERPEIRVLVLSGAGSSFCAGADLQTTSYPDVAGSWSTRRNRTSTWQRVLEQLDRIPQVTVASLQGYVVGGGALLATACDFRLVSQDVVLRIPELALGIPNVWNGTPLLAREIGLPRARDWVMTTRRVFAEELLQCGWAQRSAGAGELLQKTQALVDELLSVPPAALALTRSMTSALGRAQSGMQLGWADADLQQWALTEGEYKEAASQYVKSISDKSKVRR